jgi:hypothetical protein
MSGVAANRGMASQASQTAKPFPENQLRPLTDDLHPTKLKLYMVFQSLDNDPVAPSVVL